MKKKKNTGEKQELIFSFSLLNTDYSIIKKKRNIVKLYFGINK